MIEELKLQIKNEVLSIVPDWDGELTYDTVLYGMGGRLDSIDLVTLIVGVESLLDELFNINLTIASDRAMSWYKSPFSTINNLAEFIMENIDES